MHPKHSLHVSHQAPRVRQSCKIEKKASLIRNVVALANDARLVSIQEGLDSRPKLVGKRFQVDLAKPKVMDALRVGEVVDDKLSPKLNAFVFDM